MSQYLSPLCNEAQIDANGDPLVGGQVFTYAAGTSTPATTYTEDGVAQANPVVLNSAGLPDNAIWLQGGQAYKFVIKDANDVTLRTVDDISGVNDPANATTADQWVIYTGTPTYISATSFSLAGDQTGTFQVKRRLRSANTGGTVYSTITASSYNSGTGLTTVTVANTSGTLDSGLSQVSYGLLSASNGSVPVQTGQLIGVQVFSTVGAFTYTPTAGTASVIVEVQAGGGGSGGCASTTVGQWTAGRPGAGGGYGRKRITSGFSGATVTVGAGGTAGAVGDNAGGAGGTSSFGTLVSCTGGSGGGGSGGTQTTAGITQGAVASGGTATDADVSVPGGAASSNPFAVVVSAVVSPSGGAARFGPGGLGRGTVSNNSTGVTPSGYGGGASAPTNANGSHSAQGGAAGAPGIVIVWEYA